MKNISTHLKFALFSLILIIGIALNAGHASAVLIYTSHDIPYIVTTANIPPNVDAGADKILTSPTSSVSVTGTATDSDGTIQYTSWQFVSGPGTITSPATATIGAENHTTPSTVTLSGMTVAGTYVFRFSAEDDQNVWGSDDMQVTVNAGNNPPIVNAGPDQSINQPSSAVSVTGTASDSDGTITSTVWTRISGPSLATIVSPNSLSTSITGLSGIGTYVFRLTATDDQSATAYDEMQVVVGTSSASGWLTVSPNTCTIALNASTCTVTGATWGTTGASSPRLEDGNTDTLLSTLANNATALQVWVAYPSTVFNLKNGSTLLDTKTATATCAGGTTWDGSKCAATLVNGVCAATHFSCSAGSYPGGGTGGISGPWAWSCTGFNGGSTASCSQGPSGSPECSDHGDNDGDGLIDYPDDPGCTSALDTSERNNPKPIEIEI